ncbi:unnamed protein product [Blepharisma stoltei]|uniref:Potassium channel domain-containing protein n=1 Tax=Blepharisma stoltei TaxID=1481888 RepID=A0AAU9K3G3_9CILI|nr:unnamed protein product [Blepharisma stoltei]
MLIHTSADEFISESSRSSLILSSFSMNHLSTSSKNLYIQWRLAELIAAIFAVIGIITSTVDYEKSYSDDRTHSNCKENEEEAFNWITFAFTVISLIFLYIRHQSKQQWYRFRRNPFLVNTLKYDEFNRIIRKKRRRLSMSFFMEFIILSIFPYPYIHWPVYINQNYRLAKADGENNTVEVCYIFTEFLYVFMYVRVLFIFRAIFNLSSYQDDHARYYCAKYEAKSNVRFSIRCLMKTHPFFVVAVFIVPGFLLFGIFLRVFERPYTDISGFDFESYSNAVWCCAEAIATIGFGDLYPGTHFGRMVTIISALWGAFAFSMVVFILETSLQLDTSQNKAFYAIKSTRTAGIVAIDAFRLNLIKKKYGVRSMGFKQQLQELEKSLKAFHNTNKMLNTIQSKEEAGLLQTKSKFKKIKTRLSRIESKLDKLLGTIN